MLEYQTANRKTKKTSNDGVKVANLLLEVTVFHDLRFPGRTSSRRGGPNGKPTRDPDTHTHMVVGRWVDGWLTTIYIYREK